MWDYENMDVMFVTTLEMEHLGVGKIVKNLVLAFEGGAWRGDINDDWHNDGKVGQCSYWVIYKKIQAKNFRKS